MYLRWRKISPFFGSISLICLLAVIILLPQCFQDEMASTKISDLGKEFKGSLKELCALGEVYVRYKLREKKETKQIMQCLTRFSRVSHSDFLYKRIYQCMRATGFFNLENMRDLRRFCASKSHGDSLPNHCLRMEKPYTKKYILNCAKEYARRLEGEFRTTRRSNLLRSTRKAKSKKTMVIIITNVRGSEAENGSKCY